MGTRYISQIFDDLDGTLLDDGDGTRVTFSLGDDRYEIDLSAENARAMRALLAPYIEAARPIAARASAGAASRKARRVEDTEAVRTWGRANGYVVAERGRLPRSLLLAYSDAKR